MKAPEYGMRTPFLSLFRSSDIAAPAFKASNIHANEKEVCGVWVRTMKAAASQTLFGKRRKCPAIGKRPAFE